MPSWGQLGLWEVSRSRPADCSPPSWPFRGRSGRKDISPQRALLPTLECQCSHHLERAPEPPTENKAGQSGWGLGNNFQVGLQEKGVCKAGRRQGGLCFRQTTVPPAARALGRWPLLPLGQNGARGLLWPTAVGRRSVPLRPEQVRGIRT